MPALEKDKILHGATALAAQSLCQIAADELMKDKSSMTKGLACLLLVNGIGALKEATDPIHGGTRDPKDMTANLIGSGLGFGINLKF